MRLCPLGLFCSPFCYASWSMTVYFVVITILSYCVPSCSSEWSLCASFGLIWHIYIIFDFKSLQIKDHNWRVKNCFVKTCGIYWSMGVKGNTLLWRRSFSTLILFKSCMLRRHLLFWILDVIRLLYFSSLVHSVNSPNAMTLHSHVAFERRC